MEEQCLASITEWISALNNAPPFFI